MISVFSVISVLTTLPSCTSDSGTPVGDDGVRVAIIGGPGDVPGRFSRPRGIACEPDGTLYVVDMAGRLQKLTRDGEPLIRVEMPAFSEGKPNGLTYLPPRAPGEEPLIAASDTHYKRITLFRAKDLSLVGFRAEGAFTFATHLAPLGDRWIVTEYGEKSRLVALSAKDGTVLEKFCTEGNGPGELSRPMGIVVGPDGDLYVADACNHRVQVFAPDGTLRRTLGHEGTGPGELRYPYGIAVDPAGHVIVSEYGGQRVQVLDGKTGACLRVFGKPGAGPGEFSSPWGLALDASGRVYVADRDNHRVQAISGLLSNLQQNVAVPARSAAKGQDVQQSVADRGGAAAAGAAAPEAGGTR